MDTKHGYQIKMQFLLKEWNVRINELQEKAEQLGEESKAAFLKAVDALADKKAHFQEELEKFKDSKIEPWTDLKTMLNQTSREVDDAFQQALASFGQ